MGVKLHTRPAWELLRCPSCRAEAAITSRKGGGPRKYRIACQHRPLCQFAPWTVADRRRGEVIKRWNAIVEDWIRVRDSGRLIADPGRITATTEWKRGLR